MAAYQASDYVAAERQYKDLLAELEARGSEYERERAMALDHLAQIYMRQGRDSECEPLLIEALRVFQERGETEELAVCLGLLGSTYFYTSRYREAEAAHRRALEINERTMGSDSVVVAKTLDHLAMSLAMRAQTERRKDLTDEAVLLGERAVTLFTAGLPASHPSIHFSRQNLARYKHLGASIGLMFPSAEPKEEAVSDDIHLPATHPMRVTALLHTATELASDGDYGAALRAIDDAEALATIGFGPLNGFTDHLREHRVEILRRRCSFLLGEPTGLLSPSAHLNMQMRAHARRGFAEDGRQTLEVLGDAEQGEASTCITQALAQVELLVESATVECSGQRKVRTGNRWVNGTHVGDALEVVHYARMLGILSAAQACGLAAVIMQLHGAIGAAAAVPASRDADELATLELRRNVVTEMLIRSAMGQTPKPIRSALAESAELTQLEARIGDLRRQRRNDATARGSLDLLSLVHLQANLSDAEAVLAYFIASRALFIVVGRKNRHAFVRVEFEGGLLEEVCKSVRESAQLDSSGVAVSYDALRAAMLYDLTIWPIERHLEGIRHVFVCPEGALWSIAFDALCDPAAVDSDELIESVDPYDPEGAVARMHRTMRLNALDDASNEALHDAWFGARFTLAVLPSLGSLGERAASRRSSAARKPFLGIGNPALPSLGVSPWPPMPESELLLDALARFFHADPERDVVVRGEASVSRIQGLDKSGELANRRIICFATHAIYPDLNRDVLQQAGLVLSGLDDAEFLTELDVSQLRLDADLVLLTACYTGAPSGKSFTTPLSGLAEAFLRAGARSLLVSNWPVDLHATEMLIREMFADSSPGETLSQALQRASLAVRESRANPHFAHPLFWAGFSIIGDGQALISVE